MEFRVKGFGSLVAAALLSFAPATKARADVWVYEVLTLRPDAPSYQAEAYVGALGLIARRHGGLLVDGAIEPASAEGPQAARVVGLWRFNDVGGLDALLADPTYRSLDGLHDRTFDSGASRSLERVRALSGPAQ
ncbi:MAG: hypothetical protein WEF50_00290 [Myxococcota bacterium]